MDENFCVNGTSKNPENAVKGQKTNNLENTVELERTRIAVGEKASHHKIPNRCGSSCNASGPPANALTSKISKSENNKTQKSCLLKNLLIVSAPENKLAAADPPITTEERALGQPSAPVQENSNGFSMLPNHDSVRSVQSRVRINPSEENETEVAETPIAIEERALEEPSAPVQENFNNSCTLPSYEEGHCAQPRVRIDPCLNEQLQTKRVNIGPPPSYSFVMKQKKKLKILPSSDSSVTSRSPPPNYAYNNRGLFLTSQENRMERICNLPSFVEPVWRAHSQTALCSKCGVIVLTTTHSHDAVATHVAALILCLFGCWPCCLLPYCMNVCKNTYHHCPICQAFLGLYTPW